MALIPLTAIERDGFNIRVLTVVFEVPSENFDIEENINRAVADFAKTENGKQALEYTCGYFNLADVVQNLPNELCEKHGFKIITSALTDTELDWDHDFTKCLNGDNN